MVRQALPRLVIGRKTYGAGVATMRGRGRPGVRNRTAPSRRRTSRSLLRLATPISISGLGLSAPGHSACDLSRHVTELRDPLSLPGAAAPGSHDGARGSHPRPRDWSRDGDVQCDQRNPAPPTPLPRGGKHRRSFSAHRARRSGSDVLVQLRGSSRRLSVAPRDGRLVESGTVHFPRRGTGTDLRRRGLARVLRCPSGAAGRGSPLLG